jgi:hypothetical protein
MYMVWKSFNHIPIGTQKGAQLIHGMTIYMMILQHNPLNQVENIPGCKQDIILCAFTVQF